MLPTLLTCVAYICIAGVALVGCGTKGPLYIPEQRYPQEESSQKPMPPAEDIRANPEANTGAASKPAP